ncbi:MAG: LamG domain-containing protein, partial [Planctomycetota bacterium]
GGDVNDANGHDVYLDTDYNDVRDANRDNTSGLLYYKLAQDSNESPEDGDPLLNLELMTTYYWRVDEVNDPCIWTGSIWMFTTEDGIAYDFSPEDGIRGFNPSSPLTWTASCSATGHKLYFGADFPESIVLFEDGFEGSFDPGWLSANWVLHDASADANYAYSGTWSAKATGSETLTSDDIDATDDANAIGVSFWVRTSEPMGADELQLDYYNGSSYIPVSDFNIVELDANGQWVQFTDKITDSNYLISNFRIRLTANIGSGTIYVDDVNVSNVWPVDPLWLEAYLGGADNNYAPALDPFTTYGWRVDTVIGSDVFQGEYGAFKTGLGGLLLEMLFDGGTPGNDLPATVTDTSGNVLEFTRHTGTTGSAKYADGRFTGTSAVFDPCAGLYRQDTGDDDLLRLDGWQYTIQFWAYLPAAAYTEKAHHLMVGKQGGPWRIMISDPTDDDDIRWYHNGDNRTDAEGIITEIFDDWAHISIVFDKTAQLTQKLYIDGTVVASGSYQDMNPADNNNPMGIAVGVTNPPPFGFGQYFEGKIDELRIWDIALEPEIESATQPFPPDGSRAWEPCDPNLDTFMWKPGPYAATSQGHKIYFGDSLDDVNESADPCATLDSNSWTHGRTFEVGQTYYWRVDEVNGPTTWTGPIWEFQTAVELIDPNIVVYYPLDEISGKDVLDYSGRYFDAECDDVPHWEPDNGRYGGCMHFSMEYDAGDDDWGDDEPGNIETQSDYGAQMAEMIGKQISISVWVNGDPNQRSEIGEDMVVFEFCDDDYDDGISAEPDSTKVLAVVPTAPSYRGDVVFRAGLYPEDSMTWRDFEPLAARDTWQHFVFIKNDANMYIYLNNELVATETDCNTASLANVASSDTTLKLGAYVDNSSDYHGRLDEFQIYNKALNEQEIEAIFRGGELEPAWAPSPYDGQGNVSYNTDLTWMPGDYVNNVNGHEVYFGTNYNEVFEANATIPGPNVVHDTCTVTIFDPCLLELGQTYYWRIDEVNDPCVWKGKVWRFTVAEYI